MWLFFLNVIFQKLIPDIYIKLGIQAGKTCKYATFIVIIEILRLLEIF